jgi:hypothetical protein
MDLTQEKLLMGWMFNFQDLHGMIPLHYASEGSELASFLSNLDGIDPKIMNFEGNYPPFMEIEESDDEESDEGSTEESTEKPSDSDNSTEKLGDSDDSDEAIKTSESDETSDSSHSSDSSDSVEAIESSEMGKTPESDTEQENDPVVSLPGAQPEPFPVPQPGAQPEPFSVPQPEIQLLVLMTIMETRSLPHLASLFSL